MKHDQAYNIQRSQVQPAPLELHPYFFKVSISVTWGLWLCCTIYQSILVLSIRHVTGSLPWRMGILCVSELFLSFQDAVTGFSLLLGSFTAPNGEPRPALRLVGDDAPTISVLITACGEPIEVIVNTAIAAAAQDYPHDRLRVYILDDGHDVRLRSAIEALNKEIVRTDRAHVRCLSRKLEIGKRTYFKAGNLQFGIEETGRDHGSEYIAALDADMVLDHKWLRKLIPHLILDDRLALVIPPQKYYNTPPQDPLGQQADFSIFFGVQEILNDRLGASMCTGTGYIVRRKALNEIGGWPLADSGEDYMCSTMLSDAGWGIAFVREELQLGLAPQNLRAVVKQRMRWTDAGIEVHKRFGFYLPGSKCTVKMTWGQRIINLLFAGRDYAPLGVVLAMVLLPITLLPLWGLSDNFTLRDEYKLPVTILQCLQTASFLATKLNTYILYGHLNLSYVANFQSQEIWLAPYMAYRCLHSFLPSSLSIPNFAVCGAITSPANERSGGHRLALLKRVITPDMLLYALYVIFALGAMGARLRYDAEEGRKVTWPLLGAMLKLLLVACKMMLPVKYMIWPPTVAKWGELVREDERGVRRPIGFTKGEEGSRNMHEGAEKGNPRRGNGMFWLAVLGGEVAILGACWIL